MRKILLLSSLLSLGFVNAQNVYSYGFDAAFTSAWTLTNQSSPSTTALWSKAVYTTANTTPNQIFSSGVGGIPVGQTGGDNSFALVNYSSTSSTGTTNVISNWLITPSVNLKDGDVVSFYTRKGTDGTTDYADRLEMRYSIATTTVFPSTGSADVGSFSNLGVSVNPTLATGFVYPKVWTKYSFTVSGVGTTEIPVRFGFRYYVTSGGLNGNNSDIIGIDTFSVDRTTLGVTDEVAKNTNISIYPNPATDFVSIKSESKINNVEVFDVSGRKVQVKLNDNKLDVRNLNSGTYLITIETKEGKTTEKFIKK